MSERRGRLVGLDAARGLALVGMIIAHFVSEGGDGLAGALRGAVDGRAMPLFLVVGGVGVALASRRSTTPDADLLVRAAWLAVIGLALQETGTPVAVILHYYSAYFVLAVAARRLGDAALVAATCAVTAVGVVTAATIADDLGTYRRLEDLPDLGWALLVNGYYPVLPASALFLTGMALGRCDLGDPGVRARLALLGAALAATGLIGPLVGADDLGPGGSWIDELLDASGHSQHLAWVLSAAGTSLLVVCGCVAVVDGRGRRDRSVDGRHLRVVAHSDGRVASPSILETVGAALTRALAAVGRAALTVYVAQALLLVWITPRREVGPGEQWLTAGAVIGASIAVAVALDSFGVRGPLERLVRVGTASGGVPSATSRLDGRPSGGVEDGPRGRGAGEGSDVRGHPSGRTVP